MGIKTKTVCVKKQRKLSKVLPVVNDVSDGNGSDESHDILIENTDTGQENDNRSGGRNVISMESMVLHDARGVERFFMAVPRMGC